MVRFNFFIDVLQNTSAMKIDLKKYYEERDQLNRTSNVSGPVVTFSREYGCEAQRIARMLVKNINERSPSPIKHHDWRLLNKEIIEQSADELGIKSNAIYQRIQNYEEDPFKTLFSSMGQHYDVSDRKIIDKVTEIMTTYAKKGNVVMIGRGGSFITHDIPNRLRVRLVAPLDWRAAMLSTRLNISQKHAEDLAVKMDKKRAKWVENFSGMKVSDTNFDLVVNVKTLSDREIVNIIVGILERRGYISPLPKHEEMKAIY